MGAGRHPDLSDRRVVRLRRRAHRPVLARRARSACRPGMAPALAEPRLRRVRSAAGGRGPRGLAGQGTGGAVRVRAARPRDRPASLRQLLAAVMAAPSVARARGRRPAGVHGRATPQRGPRRAREPRPRVGGSPGRRIVRRALRLVRRRDHLPRAESRTGRRAEGTHGEPSARREPDRARWGGQHSHGAAGGRPVGVGNADPSRRTLHARLRRRRDQPDAAADERVSTSRSLSPT